MNIKIAIGVKNRINLIMKILKDFIPKKKYDLIISNPPFFSKKPKT